LHILLQAINEAYSKGELPETWTVAKIICIFKKGDASLPENYRPISLLDAVYKLYAKLILNRIQQQVDKRLRKTQYGFRTARSTSDPIHIIRRLQDLFKQKASPLHLFFIDWKQAFDKVNHEALRISLQRIGIPDPLVKAIMSMYKEPLFFVSEAGNDSPVYRASTGIRQGCPLSPFLFIIVLTLLFEDVDKALALKNITNNIVSHRRPLYDLEYADDVALFHAHLPSLQVIIHTLEEIAPKFGLQMNLLKTVHMPCFCTHNPPKLTLQGGHQVPQVHRYKYLGTIITADGSPYEAINSRLGESTFMFNNLRPVWNNRYLALKYKVKIFKAIFESKPIHGLQHSVLSSSSENKLNAWHVRHLRRVASIKHSYWSHTPNRTVYAKTHTFPIMAIVHKKQAMYLAHTLRADKDDPIRFVMLNDVLQHRNFYTVSPDKKGRPTPRWIDVVTNRLLHTQILCTKAFSAKHPILKTPPKNIQDLYNIAQDRTAFAALAHSVIMKAQRKQKTIDFPDPPEVDF
jgi:hypothetical protein